MKERPDSIERTEDASGQDARRRPYVTPKLRIFGRVVDLTSGFVGTGNDRRGRQRRSSDRRLKQNIVRIGDHPMGFGLYLFEYAAERRALLGHGRQFGVMADEVAAIAPECVSIDEEGVMRVDYAGIGVILADTDFGSDASRGAR